MSAKTRLCVLAVGVVMIAAACFYVYEKVLEDTVFETWVQLKKIELRLVWLQLYLSLQTMFPDWFAYGWQWGVVQVMKRLFFIFVLPFFIVILIPETGHRALRKALRSTKERIKTHREKFLVWLRSDRVFGQYAGLAMFLVLSLVTFLSFLFYALFWGPIAVVLAWIKFSAFITGVGSFLWRFTFGLLKRSSLAMAFLRFAFRAWLWFDVYVIYWVRLTPTKEELRRSARKRARLAVHLREERERLFELGWREYREERKREKSAEKQMEAGE